MTKVARMNKKLAKRFNKNTRKILVHAAGCTHRRCTHVLFVHCYVHDAVEAGVKVPHSLRYLIDFPRPKRN